MRLPALNRFSALDALLRERGARESEFRARVGLEDALDRLASTATVDFFCSIHGGATSFSAGGEGAINWREGVACNSCRLNARMRFSLSLMRELAPAAEKSRVYLTEQATFGYVAARRLFPAAAGSEYVVDPARRALLTEYIRTITGDPTQVLNHEDATALTFPDASFDVIGSFDVLEHVPDYTQAVREFARVLAADGLLVLTVPFLFERAETVVRAQVLGDGSIRHLLDAEYHGDPAADSGVLCFYHFGWDLLDTLRSSGFGRAEVVMTWSPLHGYLGDMAAIVATR